MHPNSTNGHDQNQGPGEIRELLRLWEELRQKPNFLATRVGMIERVLQTVINHLGTSPLVVEPLTWSLPDPHEDRGDDHRAAAIEATKGSTVAGKAAADTWEFWLKTRDGMHVVFEHLEPRGEWLRLDGNKILNPPAWLNGHFDRDTNRPLDIRADQVVLLADGGN